MGLIFFVIPLIGFICFILTPFVVADQAEVWIEQKNWKRLTFLVLKILAVLVMIFSKNRQLIYPLFFVLILESFATGRKREGIYFLGLMGLMGVWILWEIGWLGWIVFLMVLFPNTKRGKAFMNK